MDLPKETKRGRPSARDKILDATLALVKDIGAPAVTLDAVAEKAGVSKGGLLYHFPFKEDLLTAANETIVARLLQARRVEAAQLPDSPSRALKAYVMSSVYDRAGNDTLTTRMLSAGSMLKESADPIRRYWKERFPEIAVDTGFDRAALVHAATEGLWFMEVLRLSPFSEAQRARLVEILMSIVEDSVLPPGDAELNPVPLYKETSATESPVSKAGAKPKPKATAAARKRRSS